MAEDETATVKTLATYREVMASLIKQHRGRVVDSPGDNVLAEFASVVDAVQCAVAVQKEFQARNAELPEDRRMAFRIGINLGDVIEEKDRIYGDGVNIAARLEALADLGGICVSKTAFDQIETKLPLGYEYLGEQDVKNIPKPVGAYRVLMEPRVTVAEEIKKEEAVPAWRLKSILVGGVVLVLVVIAALIWNFYSRPPPVEVASVEKMAFPLPDKPSIAVLPFVNLSKDPEQEYLADGITESIITTLSKISEIFVIASRSVFTYKGKKVKIQQVSEELGVKHVLEGSVQKSGNRVRITAQLVDATTGHHLWSEQYDRDMKELFALQDDITHKIVVALQVKLTEGEQARVWHGTTYNLEAWGYFVKGYSLFERFRKEDNAKAQELFERALEIAPKYSYALTMLAWSHWIDARYGWTKSRSESDKKCAELAQKAVALDDTQPHVHGLLGGIYLAQRQYEQAIAEGEKAIELGPNNSLSYALLALSLKFAGRFERAITLFKKAMRLSPYYLNWYPLHLAGCYFMTGRYDEAIATYKHALERGKGLGFNPFALHVGLAASYMRIGQEEKARSHAEEVLRIKPDYSLEWIRKYSLQKDPSHLNLFLTSLHKAGIPETPPLPLPDKPSIAVLPFVNMSGDPEQEHFSDGITEEIITALSKVPKLFVIARHSSFTYKGKSVRIPTIGKELGVRYVLEGSVRKAGDKVRVTAQLVEAKTGKHLWAERYDRELKDIFALQDEITMKIITALQVKLTDGEQERVSAKGTDSFDAYIKYLRGFDHAKRMTKEDNLRARRLANEAIALDPDYASAYHLLAYTHTLDPWVGLSKDPKRSYAQAMKLTKKAIAMDDSLADAHGLLGSLYVMTGQHDKAIAEGERAVALNPNDPSILAYLALILRWAGRLEESVRLSEKAIRLNPFPEAFYFRHLGLAYLGAGRYEEGVEACRKAVNITPNS
jgi:adenylate cyclase